MKHIASCSFGADSMATTLLAIEHGEPLDEAAYCEIMFSDTISGEVPEHREFIYEKAIPYLKSHGIETKVLRSDMTYLKDFYTPISRGKRVGKLRGFPLCGKCQVCRDCKVPPIKEYVAQLPKGTIQYLGIASDEQDRLLRLSGGKISLLNKYGYDQTMARELAARHGMKSPIYEFAPRNGCWFCPNAKERELRHLYDHHPDLWGELLKLQTVPNKSSELFNRDMRFDEIDYNFRMDDAQMNIFDFLEV